MDIFVLKGKDPSDSDHPAKTWIVVAQREMDARKLLPATGRPIVAAHRPCAALRDTAPIARAA
jgi:hypothetical protein